MVTQSQPLSGHASELKLSEQLSNASFDSVIQQIQSATEQYGSHNSEAELSHQVKHLLSDNKDTRNLPNLRQKQST